MTMEQENALPVEAETFVFSASAAQKRLWFLQHLHPESYAYNMPSTLQLQGTVNVEALQKSIDALLWRHESLRTTFELEDDEVVQVIHSALHVPVEVLSVEGVAEREREQAALQTLSDVSQQAFDLQTGPLLRVLLLRVSDAHQYLLVNMHHIIADAWSMGVFFAELDQLYAGFLADAPVELPPLALQYADYSEWQQNVLQGEKIDKQLAYWQQQLRGELPVLALPTDHPRPAVNRFRGELYRFAIDKAQTDELRARSQQAETSLQMTLLAAFQVLLYRYTRQEDLLVGTPFANRRRETEGVIGFFLNTLVMRAQLSGKMTFRELLRQVKQVSLDAYANSDVPFDRLVQELQPDRQRNQTPLFQVMFVLEHEQRIDQRLGLPAREFVIDNASAKFDLTLFLTVTEHGLEGVFEYDSDLFAKATLERMAAHFQTLLQGIAADVDQPLAALPILPAAEREQLLVQWNNTAHDASEELSLQELFEQQVEQTPDAAAALFGDTALTYRQLNERANQLAHHLRALGVGPDVCVGLCLERSLDLLVGLLGIIKAGGAYLALDPAYPAERLAYMLADSQLAVLVTQERMRASLPAHGAQVVSMDGDAAVLAGQPQHNLPASEMIDRLVYLIYTSGSTGKPKGVAMSQHPLVNLIDWQVRNFTLPHPARVLQFTSLSFDVSFQEIFSTLCSGGTLVLIADDVRKDAEQLLTYLAAYQVERLFLPFVALQQLSTAAQQATTLPTALREIITAGEQLQITPSLIALLERLPGCTLHNHYGPSETHVVTAYVLDGNPHTWPALPPIGRAIDHVRLYVLDEQMQPVPLGVPGELYAGGVAVARGYLNRADLTAERFLPDPFAGETSARMYKTGDLVRYLPDGNLEYLGRADQQVKIRGFRIELGEIENLLRQHAAVQDAVVTVREDVPGDKRLVAYVVAAAAEAPDVAELRRFLQAAVPEYMVPSHFMVLGKLPLTASGKVDRRSLPAPDQTAYVAAQAYVPPVTETEIKLAEIWQQVLAAPRVGLRDSFFELGGHSLLATQILSRIKAAFGVSVALSDLFANPTVEGVAERIAQTQRAGQADSRVAMQAVMRPDQIPLSFAQQQLWVLQQMMSPSAVYNVPFAMRLVGSLRVEVVEACLCEIITRHESLRTTFAMHEEQPVQVIGEAVPVELPVIDLRHLSAQEREAQAQQLIEQQGERAFDLQVGPLVRFCLFRLDEQEHILAVALHHIVFDGWSLDLFLQEFAALYEAFQAGQAAPLAPLALQYAEYAIWQRQWLSGDVFDQQMAYWKEQLGGELPILQLPTDRSRPAAQTYAGALHRLAIPRELRAALHALSQQQGVTMYMAVLGAFQTLLSRYAGQEDILVGTPISGRHHQEIEELIGYFVNTLVLRTDLSGEPTFADLLERVRRVVLEAYAHQDIPFEKLVEALQPERDGSRSPLFQVMFILQNFAVREMRVGELQISEFPYEHNTSKFDLTLYLEDREEGLCGHFEYNTDLFDEETVARMATHFTTLLQGLVANPQLPVSKVDLLTAEERRQLLLAGNDLEASFPQNECLQHLFEQQVAATPDHLAVVFADQRLTYRELNARANQFAHRLRELGVGPDVLVGLSVERSLACIVGLLAILKAGGAYVPLDPANPPDRLAFILEDAQINVLLTQRSLQEQQQLPAAHVIYLEEEPGALAEHNPAPVTEPHHLAYVIYTSGSTGKPKGVLMPHCSVVRLFAATEAWYQFGAQDVWTLFHSYAFDFSVWEIWGALLYGGKLVVVPYMVSRSPQEFYRLLAQEQVTVLNQTPSAFRQLIQAEQTVGPADNLALRYVIFGGEALELQTLRPWFERHGDQQPQLVNMYGITETTVHVTYRPLLLDDLTANRGSVIGIPIPDQQLYVLDKHLQPVPYGVLGEMYVGGGGLARGYLNRPELTAERFIANPFADLPGGRLYKTGDLARRLPNGELEYGGRIDHQVKIRGFRIELGEIEAVLLTHERVQEAKVLVREDLPGDQRLVAYLVVTGEPILTSDLRVHLKKRLADYMVPSAFVQMEAFPLTTNGKLDLRALPQPNADSSERFASRVAPRDGLEWQLVQIWERLLGTANIGVTDNFFDLGGHSLLAIRFMAEVEQRFQKSISISTLYQESTIERLAALLRKADVAEATATLIPLQPSGTQRPLFLVHPIGGHVFSYTELAKALGADQPLYGFQAPGLEERRTPLDTVEALAACYIGDMLQQQPEGPYRIGGWSFGAVVAFEMAQQLRRHGQEVELLALIDASPVMEEEAEQTDHLLLFLLDLASRYGKELPDAFHKQYALAGTESERLQQIIEQALALQLLPEELPRQQVEQLIDVFRANMRAYMCYRPSTYHGRAVFVKAEGEAQTDVTQWQKHLTGDLHVGLVPGTHYSIMHAPEVATVAGHLQTALAKKTRDMSLLS